MLYPLTFQPIFKERVWGGRNLERLYGKPLPPEICIGESWEISDRPGAASVLSNGPLAGQDFRWLMEHHAEELLGAVPSHGGRFPLLIKILDAQAPLSLQVHPPAEVAAQLGGESKTELWFVTQAAPGAELYLGLRRGVCRDRFERKLKDGTVAECFHRLNVQAGDAVFLPSGRVHGIGAGIVLFEIQENSDTTYRVFDWNRSGVDGQPRELHVAQALASINFNDFEPGLIQRRFDPGVGFQTHCLVMDSRFTVEGVQVGPGHYYPLDTPGPLVLGIVSGQLLLRGGWQEQRLTPGQFCLVPACRERLWLSAQAQAIFLQTRFVAT